MRKTLKLAAVAATGMVSAIFLAFPALIQAEGIAANAMNVPKGAPAAMAAAPVPTPADVRFMRITAYASTPDETDDTPFITASGLHVRDGIVATNILPFGTEVEIPKLFGRKVFVVEDRMAARFRNTIDIWMPTRRAALYFGVAWTDVSILYVPPSPVAQARRALAMLSRENAGAGAAGQNAAANQ